ncbi:DNA polymerase III subunit alpha [Bacillus sp. EB600]|uniref:DNA polymerase III subunit alpha n=1 Tax=Bacillus sp. EB600 TaxID=2806345 RepID=UPI0021095362|nr:DNA polymerase III subunit alpha [Bacillus sp. EB600]MCQ6278357.1 DNA polymerase III subunit alpha [Bacillus sp. EB600]
MSFIHLQLYSAYSLLTSTISLSGLIEKAKSKGFDTLALTDRNVMYGTVEFYKLCKKNQIKPILGLTVDVQSENTEAVSYPLVLLAEDDMGFKNLLKISSAVQTRAEKCIPVKWIKHYSQGLIALTPGQEGEIEQNLLAGKDQIAKELIQKFTGIFGKENFFLSIQNHGLDQEEMVRDKLILLAKEMNIPFAATNHVYFLEKEDMFAHECLLAIKNGDKLQDEHREKLGSDQYYLKSAAEMTECLADFPEALENTVRIGNRCQVNIELNKTYLPKYPVENGKPADQFLEDLCMEGLNRRFTSPTNVYYERLHYELDVIKKMKFSDYFLIVWDFIKYAREQGILIGPGRGSAAGSLVAYVLNITDVDPIEHQLLFERFLNPERVTMPDIDTDFPDTRRDEVIKYVASKYGELHVAQIVTFGTMAAKAALRDVGRVFGLNTKELEQLSRLVPSRLGINLSAAYKESSQLQAYVAENAINQRLFNTALKLEGLPRHTSTHAAGVVFSEKPLVELIPIQAGHNNVYLTQYSMEYLEELGLLKMDFLGLRNLTLIDTILNSIYRNTREKLKLNSIPLNDQAVYEVLSKGETTGIFQLESEGMKKVLMRLKPTCFEDIVAVNALYRPGPMENIPLFIDRKHGRQPVIYPHPDLKMILENTYGVIVYQEQIMQIASQMAGFSLGEADLLRRAVSKKKKEVLDMERDHFVQGALNKGYDAPLANTIYDLIVRFANYGFNRSHAVAYSMIAYQLAYLKVNYPVYFMAGLLSSVIGNESKIAQYIQESKQMGIKILPPSINHSGFSFLVEKESIRYSLAAIRGVGALALKEIFRARKVKRFADLFDFCVRVTSKAVNRKSLEALVHSGSFDEFGEDRAVLLASLDVAIEHAQLVKPSDSVQFDLFAEEEFFPKPKYVQVDAIRPEDKLFLEKGVLGIYLSDHPVSTYEKELKQRRAKKLSDFTVGNARGAVGVYITSVKKIRTKKGEAMAFLSVSDESGELEAVIFPETYKKCPQLIVQGNLIVIEGKAEERSGKLQFNIQKAAAFETWFKTTEIKQAILYLKVEKEKQESAFLQQLNLLLKKYKGETGVVLHYEGTNKTVRLDQDSSVAPSTELMGQLKFLLGSSNVILRD